MCIYALRVGVGVVVFRRVRVGVGVGLFLKARSRSQKKSDRLRIPGYNSVGHAKDYCSTVLHPSSGSLHPTVILKKNLVKYILLGINKLKDEQQTKEL